MLADVCEILGEVCVDGDGIWLFSGLHVRCLGMSNVCTARGPVYKSSPSAYMKVAHRRKGNI